MIKCVLQTRIAQAESLFSSLEQVAGDIALIVNATKNEYMYFNREESIPTLIGDLLKSVDKFRYLVSSVSSENDDNFRQAKA